MAIFQRKRCMEYTSNYRAVSFHKGQPPVEGSGLAVAYRWGIATDQWSDPMGAEVMTRSRQEDGHSDTPGDTNTH